ncbi:MAG: hypothetical protein EOO24_34340 [Comamonadaceae bacterium]|nr:MAG: hypothetical protein EOO24_34340 [Comamonadaceae bacterium]
MATLEITAAASLAHVLAGGHLPAAGFLLAFAAIVFGCCLATIGRVLRVGVVVPFVLAAQIGLHAALDTAPAAHHGSMHAAAPDGPLGLTPVMLWAHLITALVTAILLLLQERVVAAVVSTWRPLPLGVPAPPRLARLLATARLAVVVPVDLLRAAPRRGPPCGTPATL